MYPLLTALRTVGCACYPYLRPYNKHKLQPKSMECVLLGYPPLSKGYLCLDPTTNTVYIVCYTVFHEDVFPFSRKPNLITSQVPFSSAIFDSNWFPSPFVSSTSSSPSTSNSSLDCISLDLFQSLTPISCVPDPPSKSRILSNSPSLLSSPVVNLALPSSSSSSLDVFMPVNTHPMLARSKLGIHKPKILQVTVDYTYDEPLSFAVASGYPQWVAALDYEFHSLLKQQTLSLVPPPPNKNIMTCK